MVLILNGQDGCRLDRLLCHYRGRKHARYSDMNIKEIVGGLHFPDQSSFTKFFKRKTGQTPRQYSIGPRSGTSA